MSGRAAAKAHNDRSPKFHIRLNRGRCQGKGAKRISQQEPKDRLRLFDCFGARVMFIRDVRIREGETELEHRSSGTT